jgi:ATP-dependent Clp protease adaptor protein ClpS
MTTPSNPFPETIHLPDASVSLQPQYHLVLMDDNDHSYAYVVEMLGHVFGYALEKAFAIACAVDGTGSAVVETASHDHVTAHQQQIHSYGSDPRIPHCKGSMSAVVESAP